MTRVGRLEHRPGTRASHDHALGVWEAARRGVAARVGALARETQGRGRAALEGQVDLVLLHLIGAHLSGCGECWEVWSDGARPGDLITAAVRRRPAGQILRVVEMEQRAQRAQRRAERAGGHRG